MFMIKLQMTLRRQKNAGAGLKRDSTEQATERTIKEKGNMFTTDFPYKK